MALNQRYDNDGRALLVLNELQLRMKEQVEKKVKDGVYEFEKVPCPVCDKSRFELLAKKDRYGLSMSAVVCRDCGLIQTNPRMNQNAYDGFYDVEYRKLYGGKEGPTDEFFREQYIRGRRIFKFIEANGLLMTGENKFVLEVGCGAGGILQYFKEMGFRVKGIDLGKSFVEYGRNQHDLDLSVGKINAIDIGEAPDLIIYSHVLEHILAPNNELQDVHNLLPNTGLLYIEIPGVKNLMHSYKLDFLRLLQNAHVYHFTLKSLENLLTRNGFRLVTGNETINSVFKKVRNENSSWEFENDYSDVIEYLRKVERHRKFYPVPPYIIKKYPKSILVRFLKAIGLLEPVLRLYRKLKASSK